MEILNTIANYFVFGAATWQPTLIDLAVGLFIPLASIEIVITVWDGWMSHGRDGLIFPLLRRGLALILLFAALTTAPEWTRLVVSSFSDAASQAHTAAGGGALSVDPTSVANNVNEALVAMNESEIGWLAWIPGVADVFRLMYHIPIWIAGVVLLVVTFFIYIEGSLLMGGGVFLLGFGGLRYTIGIAEIYPKWVFSYAIRTFVLLLILGADDFVLGEITGIFRDTDTLAMSDYFAASFALWAYVAVAGIAPMIAAKLTASVQLGFSRALPQN